MAAADAAAMRPPARHQFGAGVMRWFLQFVLKGATSLRAASRLLTLLRGWLPGVEQVPAANTGQLWLLRLGLYEVQRPKAHAADWIWLVDHTVQIGPIKCLLIVAVRLSAWEAKGRGALHHHDLAVVALEPMRQSTGPLVQAEWERAVAVTGEPRAILSDAGTDLKKAWEGFRGGHPAVAELSDIKHKTALFVKAELDADRRWAAFVAEVGRAKAQLQQTELVSLVPPSLKEKARFMNVEPLVRWGRRVLQYLDTPPRQRPLDLPVDRLETKLGWLRRYRAALRQWSAMMAVVDAALASIRRDGYHRAAAPALREQLRGLAADPLSRRVADRTAAFVAAQSLAAVGDEHLPGSTECLESLIGKGKRLEGQQSRSGFTKMVLAMAAAVAEPTIDYVRTALATVKTKDAVAWWKEKLGISVQSQRRHALLPLVPGTKTG